MSELIYLYAAYTIIWAGVFLYIFKLHMTQRRIKGEINRLREIIDGKKT
jgi:CcmD family protein